MDANVILVIRDATKDGTKTVLLVCDSLHGRGDSDSKFFAISGYAPGGNIPHVTWEVFEAVTADYRPAMYKIVRIAMNDARREKRSKQRLTGLQYLTAKFLRRLLEQVEHTRVPA